MSDRLSYGSRPGRHSVPAAHRRNPGRARRAAHIENLEQRVHLAGTVGCGCAMCSAAAMTAAEMASTTTGTAAAPIVQPLAIAGTAEKTARQIWKPLAGIPADQARAQSFINARSFTPFGIDTGLLQQQLWSAPQEFSTAGRSNPLVLSLPTPEGKTERFAVRESSVMAPALQARYADQIRTFVAQGIDSPASTARLDLTPQGFHAQVLSPDGAWYIDPYIHTGARDGAYLSYFKRDQDISDRGGYINCLTQDASPVVGPSMASSTLQRSGPTLKTYDLAVSTTGEYTSFHGGTVSFGLAAVTTVVNRLTGVYETDLTIRFQLVANNNLLINTNAATDPFSNPDNPNPTTTNQQNQAATDSLIGAANYDVGHVFHRGSNNGLAGGIGTVGVNGVKAQGFSATTSPINDSFTIDYVAHELGHQFGARHTFNNCGGGQGDAANIAIEPGSGSTIMAYAGICGSTNIQNFSDAMFSSLNFDQILTYTSSGAGFTSATTTATGNTAPTVNGGPDHVIPAGTPFELTATASDVDGDTLTYSWEQRNGGNPVSLGTDPGFGPIIRARGPAISPTRVFPRIQNLLANAFAPGEILPTTTRNLNFTVLARDNRAGGGGINTDNVVVTSIAGTPFSVTNFNSFATVAGGSMQTLTWNPGISTGPAVNAQFVDISMSIDGGFTYPIVLATNTANDGTEQVQMPFDTGSTLVRFKVKGTGRIFFDINNANLTITSVPGTAAPGLPDLDPTADSGLSNTDRITNFNNATPAKALTFAVGNTIAGATVRVFADGVLVGSAVAAGTSTVVTTDGVTVIPDGARTFTARQQPVGSPESVASLSQQVTIDTVAPTLAGPVSFNFLTAAHRVDFNFSEDVSATLDVTDLRLDNALTAGTVADGVKSVAYGPGNNASLTFPGSTGNGAAGVIEDGTFTLTFQGSGLSDVAGNPIANPTFDFFFINGDANRDRTVGIADFSVLAANFNTSPRQWADGDFNYNGTVEIGDFSILASKFNLSVPADPARPPGAAPAGTDGTSSVRVASPFGAQPITRDTLAGDILGGSEVEPW